MPDQRSPKILLELFASKTVVDLPAIRAALGGVSGMTAFRYLRKVPYRRSYNCNGRFYALHETSRYDRHGLWSWGDVHFSVDGSLRSTVRRLVHEAKTGATHRELQEQLRLRVQNTLLALLRKGEIDRERLAEMFVYLHVEASVRETQLQRRREQTEAGQIDSEDEIDVSDDVIIQVLLTLIRHPGSQPAQVARRLRGHSPPIPVQQIRAVFVRYELGEKGGPMSC